MALAHPHSSPPKQGFALVVAITLAAFLLLLVLSLATMTGMAGVSARTAQDVALARENAKFGLYTALEQLQRLAGPDRRTSARADLEFPAALHPYWTGVYFKPYSPDPTAHDDYSATGWEPADYARHLNRARKTNAILKAWLISGSDTAGNNPSPEVALASPIPLGVIQEAAGSSVVVEAGRVALPAAERHNRVGRFAYWVQDESLKALANKTDPFAIGGMANEAGMALRGSQRAAVEVIDPSLASFFSPFGGGDASRFDRLERTRSWREVNLLLADQDQVDSLLFISPHLTFWSYGVKADSWHGGLKYDLSLAFEADDDTFNAMDAFGGGNLADAFSPNPAINAGRFPTARGGSYEQHFRHGTNPTTGHTVPNANQRVKYVFMEPLDYADPPNRLELQDVSNNTIWNAMNLVNQTAYSHAQGGYIRGPTWHQLRDHYRSYKHISGSGANAVFRNQTADQFHSQYLDSFIRNRNSISSDILTQARYIRSGGTAAAAGNINNWTTIVRPLHTPKAPVMIRERWLFSLAPRLNDGVYEFDVVINPVYTLWNPYDTAIEVDRVEIRKHNADLSFSLAMFYTPIGANNAGFLITHNGTGNFAASTQPVYPKPSGYQNSRLSTLVYRQFPELFAGSGLGSDPTPAQILNAGWTLTAVLTSSGTSGGEALVFQPGEIKTFSVNAGGGAAAVDPDLNTLLLYLGPEADVGTLQSFSGFHFEDVLTVDTTTLEADTAAMFPPPPPADPPLPDTNVLRRYSPLTHDLRFNLIISAISRDSMVSEPLTEIRMVTNGDSIRTAWHWIAFGNPHASGNELEMHAVQRTYDVWVGWIHWPSNANYQAQGFLVENFFNPQAPDKQIVAAADVFLKPTNYIVWQGHNARRFSDYPVPVLGLFNPVAPIHLLTNGAVGPYPVSDIFDANFFPLYEWDGAGQFAIGLPADGEGYWGDGITGAPGDVSRVVAYSIPREPLLSLGDLRHANIANYHTQPTYTVGESFASPYVSPNGTWARYDFSRTRFANGTESFGRFHNSSQPHVRWQSVPDWTYLINEALWDGYFFSGLAPRAAHGRSLEEEFQAFIAGDHLANSRTVLIPGSEDALAEIFTPSGDLSADAYKWPARFTLNQGAFNVNSTSVEAWKAMIASTEGIRVVANVGGMTDIQNPSDRALPRHGLPLIDTDHSSSDWSGYLTLTDSQLDDLAQALVDQVRERGPFTSMGDFVNRRLAVTNHDNPSFSGMGMPTSPPAAHTRMGAVQAAITSTTINNSLNERMDFSPTAERRTPRHPRPTEYPYPDHLHENGLLKLAVPQYLTQGDLLQVLGPALSARSDTFTIRCYGDLEDPVTGEVKARVWGEAVVQRFPDPVVPSALDEYEPDDPERFGRRFRIVSFNWLSPEMVQ